MLIKKLSRSCNTLQSKMEDRATIKLDNNKIPNPFASSNDTFYINLSFLHPWLQAGLGTIILLLYCTILKHQYNLLQHIPPPIQYIGKNILYCIEIYCVKVDHQSSSSPCTLSLLSEEFSLTKNATSKGFHSN